VLETAIVLETGKKGQVRLAPGPWGLALVLGMVVQLSESWRCKGAAVVREGEKPGGTPDGGDKNYSGTSGVCIGKLEVLDGKTLCLVGPTGAGKRLYAAAFCSRAWEAPLRRANWG